MTTHLVTTLKRKATQILDEVNATRMPILITQYGKPSAFLIDVDTYQSTLDRIETLEKIARGEQAIREGRVYTHAQVQKLLAKWLK